MRHRDRPFTVEQVVRIAIQKESIEINEYRWTVGRNFRDAIHRAVKLGLMEDCGGRPDRRVYIATSLGASKVLTPGAEIKWMQRMADLFRLWIKWETMYSNGQLA